VSLLIECDISLNQLMLLWLLYTDREESGGKLVSDGPAIANLYRYAEKVTTWSFDEIDDLVKKGWMVDRNKTGADGKRQAYPDHYQVTDEFIDKVFVSGDRFEQFWESYPSFVENFDGPRGPMIPLKATVMEEVEVLYKKRVRTIAKHKQVMEILDWAKKRGLINMNIAKYVGSMMFDQHMQLKNQGSPDVTEHRLI